MEWASVAVPGVRAVAALVSVRHRDGAGVGRHLPAGPGALRGRLQHVHRRHRQLPAR